MPRAEASSPADQAAAQARSTTGFQIPREIQAPASTSREAQIRVIVRRLDIQLASII
jgi:hypothetical protein